MSKFTVFVEKHERPYGERERRVIDRVEVTSARTAARRATAAVRAPAGMYETKAKTRRVWVLDAKGREVMTCHAARGKRRAIARCTISNGTFKASIKKRRR